MQFVFLSQVGPRDQTSEVFGRQNGPESELWSDISGPKIDKNSVSKKKGPKSRKVSPKIELHSYTRDILEPRGPWGRQIIRLDNPKAQNRQPFFHNADGLKPGELGKVGGDCALHYY